MSRDRVGLVRPSVVVGAAGGVGTSTLARDLRLMDCGRWWPATAGQTLVVVTSGTADGMAAVMTHVHRLDGLPGRIVVAVIDDGGGPCPPVVKARKRLLVGHVHAVVDVPYVTVWRYAGTQQEPGAAYWAAIQQLTNLATPTTTRSKA